MLESFLAWALNNCLEKYVENLNINQLSIVFLQGKVELENLQLKKDVFRYVGLPVKIDVGYVGKAKLQIPVPQFWSAPWVVTLEHLRLILSPVKFSEWDKEAEGRSAHEYKLAQLKALEKKWSAERQCSSSSSYYASIYSFCLSLCTNLVADIGKNLQLKIKHVHIRYEDDETIPGQTFAFGITIDALSVQNCDDNWNPISVNGETEQTFFKLIKLNGLSVYCDSLPKEQLIGKLPFGELTVAMSKYLNWKHQYILFPVSVQAHVSCNYSGQPLIAWNQIRIVCGLHLEEIFLSLTDWHYETIIHCINGLQRINKCCEYRAFRPKWSIKENPKAWWLYAATCHVKSLQRNAPGDLNSVLKRAKENFAYIDLCCLILTNATGALTSGKILLKNTVEVSREIEELKSLWEIAMKRVWSHNKELANSTVSTKGSFLHWFPYMMDWNYAFAYTETTTFLAEQPQLGDELFFTDTVQNSALPQPHTVLGQFNLTVKKGAFNLCTAKYTTNGTLRISPVEIMLKFENIVIGLEYQPPSGSHKFDATVGTVFLRDQLTQDTAFPVLLGSQFCHSVPSMNNLNTENVSKTKLLTKQNPFFRLTYEYKPLHSTKDYRFHIITHPLGIIYNPGVTKWLVNFFMKSHQAPDAELKVPHQSHCKANKQKIGQENIKILEQILERGVSYNKTWDIELDISAPKIVFVKNFCDKNALITLVDFGKFHFCNQVNISIKDRNNEGIAESHTTQSLNVEDSNSSFTEPPLHHRYTMDFEDLQIMVGRVEENNWKYIDVHETSTLHVIDKFSISLGLEKKVVYTTDVRIPSLILSGNLSILTVHVNEQKIDGIHTMATHITNFHLLLPDRSQETGESNLNEVEDDVDAVSINEVTERSTSEISSQVVLQFAVGHISFGVRSQEKPLAELQISGVKTSYTECLHDTSLLFTVHSLLLVDARQTLNPDFERRNDIGRMDIISESLQGRGPATPTSSTSSAEPVNSNVFKNFLFPINVENESVLVEINHRHTLRKSEITISLRNMRFLAIVDWWDAIRDFIYRTSILLKTEATDDVNTDNIVHAENSETIVTEAEQPVNTRDVSFEIKFSITGFEIVVVEDPSQCDSRAMILKNNLVILYQPDFADEPLSCNLNHFELFSCILGMENESACSIIEPITVDIKVSPNLENTGVLRGATLPASVDKVLKIQIQRLNIQLSYYDMIMFIRILNNLPKQTQYTESQESGEEIIPANALYQINELAALGYNPNDCSAALVICNGQLDEAAVWLTQNAIPVNCSPERESSILENQSKLLFQLVEVKTNCLSICIIDDYHGVDVPLIELSLSEFQFQHKLVSKTGSAKCSLAGDYYNHIISGWEPVIEPWNCEISWHCNTSWSLTVSRLHISISAQDILNISMTRTLFHLYSNVTKNWTEEYYNLSNRENIDPMTGRPSSGPHSYRWNTPFAPFALRNDTGCKLWFKTLITAIDNIQDMPTRQSLSYAADGSWLSVEPGETVPFNFEVKGKVRLQDTHKLQLHHLCVKVDGWHHVSPVPVDRVGVYFRDATIDLQSGSRGLGPARIVFDVTLERNARKLVTVRSALLIHNRLQESVEIRLDTTTLRSANLSSEILLITPGSTVPVPLSHVLAAMYVHPLDRSLPENHNLQWSISWDKVTQPGEKREMVMRHHDRHQHAHLFKFCTSVYRENYPLDKQTGPRNTPALIQPAHVITIHPVLTLYNHLPCDLYYTVKGIDAVKQRITPGSFSAIHQVNMDNTDELFIYLENISRPALLKIHVWFKRDFRTLTFKDINDHRLHLDAMICLTSYHVKVYIYACFWIINKTHLPIIFRQKGVSTTIAGQFEEHEATATATPLLFSFPNDYYLHNFFVVRVGNNFHPTGNPQWCRPFNVENGSKVCQLHVSQNDNRPDIIYEVGINVRDHNELTKIVEISPRFKLFNKSSYTLQYAQICCTLRDPCAQETILTAVPGSCIDFHWPHFNKEQQLCVRPIIIPNCLWSKVFVIATRNSYHINIKDRSSQVHLLQVDVVLKGATYLVEFNDAGTLPPPLRIDNNSEIPLEFYQTCVVDEQLHTTLRPHSSVPYAWDEPMQPQCITLVAPGGVTAQYDMGVLEESRNAYDGPNLTYENLFYICFTATFEHALDNDDVYYDSLHPGSQQLVLVVLQDTHKVILSRKISGAMSQLWRMTNDGQLQYEGSSPPHDTHFTHSSDLDALVLDIVDNIPRPTQYTNLVLRHKDLRRRRTQTWKFTEEGRLCCSQINMYAQAKDGFHGMHEGSEAVLGPPQPIFYQLMPSGIPVEQAVSRQNQRPGSGILTVRMMMDGPTAVIYIVDQENAAYIIRSSLEEEEIAPYVKAIQEIEACIIGARKKKVLYIGIRNRYCSICSFAKRKGKTAAPHICFKNWSKSATSMEADIIAEGFRCSEEMHGVKYHEIIADGDSSVHRRLLELMPYGPHRLVKKVECRNHLLRNYSKSIVALSRDSKSGFPIKLRKNLADRSLRLVSAVSKASDYWKKQTGPLSTRVQDLKKDILNSPLHIFGQHSSCSMYFCDKSQNEETKVVQEMKDCGLWYQLQRLVDNLSNHAGSLIYNETNNPCEILNNVTAKFLSGKRINYSSRSSFNTRCNAAVISLNSAGKFQTLIHKTMQDGESPDGLIGDDAVIEIKCPAAAAVYSTPQEAITKGKITIDLPHGIGISLVSHNPPEELVFIHLTGILLKMVSTKIHQTVDLSVQHIQCDNQLFEAQSSVVLYFTSPSTENNRESGALPAINVPLERMLVGCFPNCEKFMYLKVTMKNFTVIIDELLLLKLLAFAFYNSNVLRYAEVDESEVEIQRILTEVTPVCDKKYYFELLMIEPVKVRLSALTTSNLPQQLQSIKRMFGLFLVQFENSNMCFGPFVKHHTFRSGQFFVHSVLEKYKVELTSQLAAIVGSADFLGDPLGLINSIADGISDGSLIQSYFYGLSNSAAKVTGSLSYGLSIMGMDEQHEKTRQKIHVNHSGKCKEHLAAGLKSLSFGILGGFSGLVSQPIKGAASGGVEGFFKGYAKGVCGFFTKPVAGALGFASETANAAKVFIRSPKHPQSPTRSRPPRCIIGPCGLLPLYSEKQSKFQEFLYSINNYDDSELFIAYECLLSGSQDLHILVSSKQIFIFTMSNSQKHRVIFKVHVNDLIRCKYLNSVEDSSSSSSSTNLRNNNHEVEIEMKNDTSLSSVRRHQGTSKKYKFRCDNEQVAKWVTQQINYAKVMYEERRYTLLSLL